MTVRRHRKSRQRDIKDRLVQTRVPERLEAVLKEEAKKRRLSVSHLIRNVLEDTLELVDTVVTSGEELVDGSVRIAQQVARDAGRLAQTARASARETTAEVRPRRSPSEPEPRPKARAAAKLEHILAWNAVVLNRAALCAECGRELAKGEPAHLGLSQDGTQPPAWLCSTCLANLG
jgi:hypothetical protein